MKFFHLSDLHLGKRLNEYSLMGDQKYILEEIINRIDEEKPQGIIIAGDVYDKAMPSAEAVQLFDDFLFELTKRNLKTFIISGNHDSPERIAFGSRIMSVGGVYLSPVYDGEVKPITLTDEYGELNVYLLPFVRPINVKRYFEGEEISSYTSAVKKAVDEMNIDQKKRNLLVTHQFITGSIRSESEEVSIGGTDNVDISAVEGFDYVALGHIHTPQNCKSGRVRYSGTPLKYSFSEAKDNKSITVVEFFEKGNVGVREIPLKPLREMVELKGKYIDLTYKPYYENTTWQEDYVHITLTDEEDIPDAIGKLRNVYHNLMKLDYDNERTRQTQNVEGAVEVEKKTPFELFSELYELQNNKPMSEAQSKYLTELIKSVWEEKQ